MSVGKVERIEFQDVGKVLVSASLPPKIKPRVDASATIVSVTLVGDYAVDFDPGRAARAAPAGAGHSRHPGRRSLGPGAWRLSDRADSVLIGAQAIVNQRTADQLYATMNALQATLKAAQQTMEMYGDPRQGSRPRS